MDAVPEQARVLLVMAVGGLVLGFVYDLYRLVRWRARPRRFTTFVGDLLFWAVASGVFAVFMLLANFGEVRAGALLGTAFGLLAYHALFSRFVVSALGSLCRGMSSVLGAVRGWARGAFAAVRGAFSVGGLKVGAFIRRFNKGKGV